MMHATVVNINMCANVSHEDRRKHVEWMFTVQKSVFNLSDEICIHDRALFLAVDTFDRYLCKADNFVPQGKLWLVTATCVMLASKMEDRDHSLYPNDMVYICKDRYDVQEFVDMEVQILKALDWRLASNTIFDEMYKMSDAIGKKEMYLAELALTHVHTCLGFTPETVAQACMQRKQGDTCFDAIMGIHYRKTCGMSFQARHAEAIKWIDVCNKRAKTRARKNTHPAKIVKKIAKNKTSTRI